MGMDLGWDEGPRRDTGLRFAAAAPLASGGCSVERMEGLLIGFVWLVVIVGGATATAAVVQMIKSPYRNR